MDMTRLTKQINTSANVTVTLLKHHGRICLLKLPKGCSKGESLKKYQKYKGVSDENIYVVGDSGNDISMFKEYYENSFCMKHSSPAVKKYAKHILRRFYDLQAYL